MIRVLYILGCICLIPGLTKGNDGFKLNLSGARYLGMGHTGLGLSLDASSIYLNPGAMGFLKKNSIQLGSSFLRPSTTFSPQTQGGQSLAPETIDMLDNTITPVSVFANWRAPDARVTFGIGVYNPFGYKTQWPKSWKGKLISQESSINSLYVQPTVSYRINDRFGIGAGLSYGFANFLSQKILDINGRNNTEGWLELSGRGNGVGYNLGCFFKLGIRTSIGINFQSPMNIAVEEGQVSFNVPPSLQSEFERDRTFTTDFTFPGSIGAGLSYKSLDNLVFALDVNYTFWSSYDALQLTYPNAPDEVNQRLPKSLVKNFKNTFSIRMGTEFILQNRYFIRFGAMFNESPVQDEFVSPEFPDSDRIGLTTGLGIKLFEDLLLDVAYKFNFTGESFGELREDVFVGKYESTTNVLGIALNYNF